MIEEVCFESRCFSFLSVVSMLSESSDRVGEWDCTTKREENKESLL